MEDAAHLQLLQRMADLPPPLFAMGGFAEDALLHQCLTRSRADLDLLVERKGLDTCLRQLQLSGVHCIEPSLADSTGRPLCLANAANNGPTVEIWVCDHRDDDGYSLELPWDVPGQPSQSGRFRLTLPRDTFQTPATLLDGTSIHVVSPLALYLLRETSALTRSGQAGGAEDREIGAALKQAYLGSYSEDQLRPQLLSV